MTHIQEPKDQYDVAAWNAYYAANPGKGRSVGAAADDGDGEDAGDTDGDSGADGGAAGADDTGGDDAGGADDGGGDDGATGDQNPWPEDWRNKLAGEDDKVLKQLGRFADPAALLTSYKALELKLNTKEGRGELPDGYTDEELAAYREANGIPAEVDGYFTDMPDGLVIGDEDKDLFDGFAQALHDKNFDPAVAHTAVEWYYKMQEDQQAAQQTADESDQKSVEDAMRVEWGNDYRATINTLDAYFEKAPEGVADVVLNARGPDGKAIMNDPEVAKWFAAVARAENPIVTLTPGAGGNTSVEDEKNELEKLSGNHGSEYWKGPKAEEMQARLREIYEWEEKNKA